MLTFWLKWLLPTATLPVVSCVSLAEAVQRGFEHARAGDTVLLAPACSSFDMFRDYAARGDAFKEEVRKLAEQMQRKGQPQRHRGTEETK